MATRLAEIVNTEWRRIAFAGDKGTCWKKTGGTVIVCSTDQEGSPTLPLSNTNVTTGKSKRVPLDEDSREVLSLNPLKPNDAFYALSIDDPAQIVVDIGGFGPELIDNGNFTDWTGVAPNDKPDDWGVNEAGDASSKVTENPADQCQMISDGTLVEISQNILTGGKTYRYSIDLKSVDAGALSVGTSADLTVENTPGVAIGFFDSVDTKFLIKRNPGVCDITFDDVSVKEVL